MAFQSGSDDETDVHILFGHCLSRKAAIDGLVYLAVPLHEPAAETAREFSWSGDVEVEWEVA